MDYTDFLELIELAGNGDPTGVAYSEVGAGVYLVMAWLENDSGLSEVRRRHIFKGLQIVSCGS